MSCLQLILAELRAIYTNSAIFLIVFIGVIFYSFLYPQPYAAQVPREISLVVANLDNTQLSRKLERMVDASPQIHIVKRTGSIETAQQSFVNNRYGGLLVIPENFHKDIRLGKRPTLSYAGDASYFLVYGTVLEGLVAAGATLGAELKVVNKLAEGVPQALALQSMNPVRLNTTPVFNSTVAYLNYVLPAVFLLILHHTLIIASGLLTGGQKGKEGYWTQLTTPRLLLLRTSVLGTIYTLLFCYYYGVCLGNHEVQQTGNIMSITLIILPFFISCSFFGVCLGQALPHREYTAIIVLLSSLPLVFCTGFVWPMENVPFFLVALVHTFPFAAGVQALLKVNMMGAQFNQILPHIVALWGLVFLYGGLAYFLVTNGKLNTIKETLSRE